MQGLAYRRNLAAAGERRKIPDGRPRTRTTREDGCAVYDPKAHLRLAMAALGMRTGVEVPVSQKQYTGGLVVDSKIVFAMRP